MNKIMKILGVIFSIVLIIAFAVYFTTKDSKNIKSLHIEYKSTNSADEFNGKVQKLYTEKGACFVTIDSKKVFLKTSANYLYPEIYLDHIISVGDSIVKQSGSDTIIVHKENLEYHFVLGKFINKPK